MTTSPDDAGRVPLQRMTPVVSGGRRVGLLALFTGIALLIVVRVGAGLLTDSWWFATVEQRGTWRRLLIARTGLALVAIVVSVLVAWVNLWWAERRIVDALEPQSDVTAQYMALVGGRTGLVRAAAAVVVGILAGPLLAGHWQDLLLFLNRQSFSGTPNRMGAKTGFFVFQLPFLTAVTAWLIVLVVLTTVITAASYYVSGAIRPQNPGDRIGHRAGVHLSVLLAVLSALISLAIWWSRYALVSGTRGRYVGLLYVDRNVRLPAYALCALIGLVVAGVLIVNARVHRWSVVVMSMASWLAVTIIIMGVAPALVQSWRVNSNENELEARFVEDNLQSTQSAYGLDLMQTRSLDYRQGVAQADLSRQPDVLRNVRLWDPTADLALAHASATQQQFRYFTFNDMDVDRYRINGVDTEVMLSVRELKPNQQKTWVNRTLRFTHGFGAVLAPTNEVSSGGPKYVLGSPASATTSALLKQPRVYVGEKFSGYVVGATGQELDFGSSSPAAANYSGGAGVTVDSFFRRAAFAVRFGDLNLVKRNFGAKATVLFRRDIVERARTLAPFLRFDADPYPVLLNGRILWILDGYTTTDNYPASQRHSLPPQDLPNGSELATGFNYIRNSVKVVIDAYDGTTQLYRVDRSDPIIAAWSSAFPGLFLPASQIEKDHPGLGAHFRYPEDLLRVQSSILGRYHQENAPALISDTDRWEASPEAPRAIGESGPSGVVGDRLRRSAPYYVNIRLPGSSGPQFGLVHSIENYKEDGRPGQLTALLVGRSDNLGKAVLDMVTVPARPDGPALIAQQMASEPQVSRQQTELGQRGSKVILGSVQTIPVGRGLLFVRSMYTVADPASGSVTVTPPQLVRVIVSDGKRTVLAPSLDEAVNDLVGGNGASAGDAGGGGTATVDQLVGRAAEALRLADEALAKSDLAAYQAGVKKAQALLSEAVSRSSAQPSTTAPATTSTKPAK